MADDKRNFRSYYYEKFGFRGVEEKKSIEILLNDKPLDLEKLSQFCLRFPVPSMHRAFVWKVMLGVIPPYQDVQEFVLKQRQEQYDELLSALRITRRINDDTPKSEVFLKMFLLENGKLKLKDETQFAEEENQNFLAIAIAFGKMFNSELDVYWLTRNFIKNLYKVKENGVMLYENFLALLKKEDLEVYNHLEHINAIQLLPFKSWQNCCFAGTLHDKFLEKIWDKVIGGSCKVLPYVGVALLMTCRRPLLSYESSQEVNKYIYLLTEEASELIANQAIEMWKKHGEVGRVKN